MTVPSLSKSSFKFYQICNKPIGPPNVASFFFFFSKERIYLKNAVTNQYKNVSKITSTNQMLFLTVCLYWNNIILCEVCVIEHQIWKLCWILFLTAFFRFTKIPIIQYSIEVDSREKFNIDCLPATFNMVPEYWNGLTHWNIKCICHIYWGSILCDHI